MHSLSLEQILATNVFSFFGRHWGDSIDGPPTRYQEGFSQKVILLMQEEMISAGSSVRRDESTERTDQSLIRLVSQVGASATMRCFRRLAVSLAMLIAFDASARAQPEERGNFPGIVGKDDRQIIDSWDHPWSALGQVNVSGYSMLTLCTGTLIAPNLVLTAAHCLIDHWKRAPHPAHTIHFVAGVRRGKSLGHSAAKCVRFPKGYRYVGPERIFPDLPFQSVPFEAFNKDIAVIVLAEKIPIDPIPLAKGMEFDEGLPLIHPSYGGDRRFLLSGDLGCRLISKNSGVWGTTCDTHPGSSGGPILVKQDDDIRVAAVMVGAVGGLLTVAVPITEWEDLSLDENCP